MKPIVSITTKPQRIFLNLAAPVVLVLIAVVAYCTSFSGAFVFDDIPAIQTNPSIRNLSRWLDVLLPPNDSGTTVNGRPLVNLTFALNFAFGAQKVVGYHLVNLAIHLAATLALFGVARRLFVQVRGRPTIPLDHEATLAAAALAALWSLHPLQTQAVTYIVQRAESLVGLFFLLTLFAFCRSQTGVRPRLWLTLSVFSCLLGVASKEVIASAPILVLICDRAFYSASFFEAWRRNRIYYICLFATWIPLCFLIISSQGRGGTVGFNLAGITWWTYLLTQADAIVRYLSTALWPSRLVFDYGTGTVGGLRDVWWQGALVVLLLLLSIWGLVSRPRLGFLGAWFFLILAPSSSFVPIVTETRAEHRMYLPLAAVLALLVQVGRRLPMMVSAVGLAVAVFLCSVLTFKRNQDYQSPYRLWESSVRNYPQSARAHNNLGELLGKQRRFDEAVAEFQQAIRIQPTYLDALCNLSGVLSQMGRFDEALIILEGLVKAHPREASVQGTYGGVLYRMGRNTEAEVQFKRTLELAPFDVDAHNNLGVCLYDRNLMEEAIQHFKVVLSLFPDDASSLYNWGNALVKMGKPLEAEEKLRQSIAAEPARYEAYNNLGALYAQKGQPREAITHFRRAVELAPEYADALNNLGVMLAGEGQVRESIALFEQALRVRPDYPDALVNLQRSRDALRAAPPQEK